MGIKVWVDYEWQPGANTYMYVKGNGSVTDTGKNKMALTTQNLQFGTEGDLQYIKFPGASANGFYTTAYKAPLPITYSFLINYDGGGVYYPRLLDNTDSNDNWLQICFDRTTPGIHINGTTIVTTSTNKWYHIVITQDASGNVKAYRNGALKWSGTITTSRYNGIIVGFKKSNNSDYFSGKMAEILIEDTVWDSNTVKDYSNRIMSLYGLGGGRQPGANTVAYYPFRDDILDYSGNNKSFTGSGYTFSNNTITLTSTLKAPLVTPEQTTGDRTINVRMINPTTDARYHFRYQNGSGTNGYLDGHDYENGNRPGASLKPTTSTWYRNYPSSVSVGTNFLMTWTKTGNTMKLYLNGTLVSTTSLGTSTWGGGTNTDSRLQPGTYGEIIVEDKIWTEAEIEDYYNSTKSLYGL